MEDEIETIASNAVEVQNEVAQELKDIEEEIAMLEDESVTAYEEETLSESGEGPFNFGKKDRLQSLRRRASLSQSLKVISVSILRRKRAR